MMKTLLSLLLVTAVSAGLPKPEILVGINVGEDQKGSLGGIEPRLKWANSGEVAGIDVAGGVDVTVQDPPATNVWGKLTKSFGDVGDISVRGDMDVKAPESVYLDVRGNAFGAAVQVVGQAGASNEVSRVQVTQDFNALGGTFTVNPKYNVGANQGDVRLGYAQDGTSVMVDAQAKKLTVAHSFTDKDRVTPSVSASGDVSLSYSRELDVGRITTTWTPNDSVKLQWSDGVYETTIKAPLEGYYKATSGVRVNIKRSVSML